MRAVIPSLAQQLQEAGAAAQRLAAELRTFNNRQNDRRIRRKTSRSDKYGPKGLRESVMARLPVGEANAVNLAGVRALLVDIEFAESGLSAMLTTLFQEDAIGRSGVKYAYRYYRLS